MPIDSDLTGLWVFRPKGLTKDEKRERVWEDYTSGLISRVRADEMLRFIEEQIPVEFVDPPDEYGEPPFVFRAVRQNGSRLHLRLQRDGKDAKYPATGEFIERRAYTSDIRRGIYWTRPETVHTAEAS